MMIKNHTCVCVCLVSTDFDIISSFQQWQKKPQHFLYTIKHGSHQSSKIQAVYLGRLYFT